MIDANFVRFISNLKLSPRQFELNNWNKDLLTKSNFSEITDFYPTLTISRGK